MSAAAQERGTTTWPGALASGSARRREWTATWRTCAEAVSVGIAYYIAARLGMLLQLSGMNASVFWPASGIALAAMMLLGARVWPGILVAAFLVNVPTRPSNLAGFAAALAIGVGNAFEPIVAFHLLRRFVGAVNPFDRPRDAFRFVAIAVFACALAAANGAVSLLLFRAIPLEEVWSAWNTWWLGDLAGILVLTPAIYSWWHRPQLGLPLRQAGELFVLVGITTVAAEFFFGGWTLGPVASRPFAFVLPALLWAAFRFSPREVSALAVIVALIAIGNVWWHVRHPGQALQFDPGIYPPFLRPGMSPNESMMILQCFVCVVIFSAMMLGAAVNQRKTAERSLARAHADLEVKVRERTVELTQVNIRLQQSLDDKEVLLKEIHHRVKNNLQVISSLLQLQAQHATDPHTLEMFRESRNRVRSMALVHERLYQSADLNHVDFTAYIRSLADHMIRTYQVDTDHIKLDFDAGQVDLGIDAAVPCGLIVNELISNCLKHAFPEGKGEIRIGLHATSAGRVMISVGDNGIGMPGRLTDADTFGLGLVSALVQQLHGWLEIERAGGTTMTLSFPAEATP